ncbi:sugar transferase [Halosimplex aquaticum]|uniref:Sugar transferase n=1 Tax=Halosimplex aquaticum TaxID=3026162 RepID=A0ABD5Y7D5_9EURY|nr:sugar transferase [Halosimplex aquaticum]
MAIRWRYRLASVVGTVFLTAFAVLIANHSIIQDLFSRVPYFGRPAPAVLVGGDLTGAISTVLVVTLAAMWPVFKPRPRRILDTLLLTQKRVFLAMVGLAALGYYNYTYRLPRSTLMLLTSFLLAALPAWMITIRRRPSSQSRAIIIGDDPQAMEDLLASTDLPVLGFVSPPSSYVANERRQVGAPEIADGGMATQGLGELSNLGGLSRLDEVFVKYDIDTALLAFTDTDREEFFGTLAECYEHGVIAQVHRDYADSVLTEGGAGGDVVEVDLEPWDWQDHVAKRAFDVVFALSALSILFPAIISIAIAIKLDSPGPVFYSQERTAELGDTFTVYKFRSMVPNAESMTGAKLSEEDRGGIDPRVTRVGRVLRKTHLDEIPQLWSILAGDMSVVGPRPERPELDDDIEDNVGEWRRRWFVRPGLTGLAQINDATGYKPEQKLRYDIEYIRKQSFWFDLKIVIRQLWQIGTDAVGFLNESSHE